jgi:hypothetical protein
MMSMRGKALFLFLFVNGVFGCSGPEDCSYNGKCETSGTCTCKPAWSGEYCERLAVIPGLKSLGYQGVEGSSRLSSWGGAPLIGDDGLYHMITSEMVNHAGLLPWGCNSQVIHATSPDPLTKPFIKQRVLWEVFSHEPRCTRVPAGNKEFVCYFSHNPHYPSSPCDGRNGSTLAQCACDNSGRKPTYMSYTTDVNSGNWTKPVMVIDSDVDLNLSP